MTPTDDLSLSVWELNVLRAVTKISESVDRRASLGSELFNEGWTTSAMVRLELGSKSLDTRRTLRRLVDWGCLETLDYAQAQFFRMSGKGHRALLGESFSDVPPSLDSSSWTGVVTPLQIIQILQIVSEIEDVCEEITNNETRSQIFGLVRALEILLEIPNPPRLGIVSLVRDPAFANIVQVGTLFAAIVAAVKA